MIPLHEFDDALVRFEADGAPELPDATEQGHVEHDGARIWYATFGEGAPVILLHGGLGHSGNWGYQVPALVDAGYRVIVIDSRGHGRSTRDARPYDYRQMASDVREVMNVLALRRAAFVGWSDGAVVALVLGALSPERVAGVFFFGCNMDASGVKPIPAGAAAILTRCMSRHRKDHARLSPTPAEFDQLAADVRAMQTSQPEYSAEELRAITVPTTVVQAEHDEFITAEHAAYLAATLPNATLVELPGVSHFAPLQRPGEFNDAVLEFLAGIPTSPSRDD